MSVTIKDIAKSAGVSYSTVSKALRDSPLVKKPTKDLIMAVANELGYQPNIAARSLVSKNPLLLVLCGLPLNKPFSQSLLQLLTRNWRSFLIQH
ncbi:LacI family DNA-binding transcriptional regulator [Niallia circulans]